MRRDLERRLRDLEIADAGSSALEIWVTDDGGTLCGPRGDDGVHLASMPPRVALAPGHNRPTVTGALANIDRF